MAARACSINVTACRNSMYGQAIQNLCRSPKTTNGTREFFLREKYLDKVASTTCSRPIQKPDISSRMIMCFIITSRYSSSTPSRFTSIFAMRVSTVRSYLRMCRAQLQTTGRCAPSRAKAIFTGWTRSPFAVKSWKSSAKAVTSIPFQRLRILRPSR